MAAWTTEPPLIGEERWTPGGQGWHAWSGPSAEVEFCDFVGAFVRLLRPRLVVETGVGAGFTTRRILAHLPDSSTWIGVESDPDFRAALAGVGVETREVLGDEVRKADLVVLDSTPDVRLAEFDGWARNGKRGSILVCHDVSAKHKPPKPHRRFYDHIATSGIPGVVLPNPRGGWIGQHP